MAHLIINQRLTYSLKKRQKERAIADLKTYIERDTNFLRALYECENHLTKRQILKYAEDSKINTLLKYVHFFANGEINTTAENFSKIRQSGKLKLVYETISELEQTVVFLQFPRYTKLHFLYELLHIYTELLTPVFSGEKLFLCEM